MMGKILMTQGVIVVDCAVADVAACYSPVSWFCMMQRDQRVLTWGSRFFTRRDSHESLKKNGSRTRYDGVLSRSRSRAVVVDSCPGPRDAIAEAGSEVVVF